MAAAQRKWLAEKMAQPDTVITEITWPADRAPLVGGSGAAPHDEVRRYNTVRSDHACVTLPDGSEEWRNVTCPPGGGPGKTLELKDKGRSAMVLVPFGVGPGDRFDARPVHFDARPAQTPSEAASKHRLCPHPDGGWVWRDILCRPGDKPGMPLRVASGGVNMVVVVPPGTAAGERFEARPIDYDLKKRPYEQKPEIQKLISGDKLK
jgi:hypothetical protein